MKITTLFLDVGGVLMTNGWDHQFRQAAAQKFGLEWDKFEKLHEQYNAQLETDAISLDEYLKKVVFWKKRDFTVQQFKEFIFAHSKPFPEMLELFTQLKKQYSLKIALVSNEGKELTLYRIQQAHLKELAEYFFFSCFVHLQNLIQLCIDELRYCSCDS